MSDRPEDTSKRRTGARLSVRMLRWLFGSAGHALPGLMASLAARLFGSPPRHRTSEAERRALASGRPARIMTPAGSIATWTWGEGPAVLLVHGWGSRGARLRSFVEPLVAAGYSAIAFDAPGHGDSSGRTSSLPQFAMAIDAVARAAGGIEAAVAHSMGCPSIGFAMTRGLTLRRAVFLAPPTNPGDYTQRFAEVLSIPPAVITIMKSRFERRYRMRWEELDLPRAAKSFSAELLVIHDREDGEVPWASGAAIAAAWPGARFVTTEGLGHTRIVHDPDVVARAMGFLNAPEGRRREAGGT